MGYKAAFLVLVPSVAFGLVGYFILRDGELPVLPVQYWGSSTSKSRQEDTSIRPFQINISEKVLTDLKTRLALEVATLEDRITDSLEGVGFEYGMNKNFLKKVTTHWLNKYDWRQREKLLNKYPSFKTRISGIDIHFQHIKPTKKSKLGNRPLLLLHGWPASFTEYQKMIPLLVDSNNDINFELVIPSLPGFGFSEGAKRPGLSPDEMGPIFLKLMKRLGHEKFYVQGGDYGSIIASIMGTLYKDNVLGIHMTSCISLHPRVLLKHGVALLFPHFFMDADEIVKFTPRKMLDNMIPELGYFYQQATKPDTLGVSLSYSPSGLLSWILEKYSFWTNPSWINKEDGGISGHFNLDEILDNVMVHWVGSSETTAIRIYKELLKLTSNHMLAIERAPTHVPASCLNLPEEPLSFPKYALLEKFPNLRYTNAKKGGHLNALEIPEIVAKDIVDSILFMDNVNKQTPNV